MEERRKRKGEREGAEEEVRRKTSGHGELRESRKTSFSRATVSACLRAFRQHFYALYLHAAAVP